MLRAAVRPRNLWHCLQGLQKGKRIFRCVEHYLTYTLFQGTLGRDLVAIKCISKRSASKAWSDNLISEISILKKIKCEFVVVLKDFQWDTNYIYLIFEYCPAGDLYDFIKQRKCLPEPLVKHFLQQLASALKVLRANEIAHLDLKPKNILVSYRLDGSLVLKLADFGFAQHLRDDVEITSLRGSPLYMAPEILCKHRYDARADIWSTGVILYECLFGEAPFASDTFAGLAEKIKSNNPITIPSSTCRVSMSCKDLIVKCLQRDPNLRISYDQFFSHKFLDLEHMPSEETYKKGVEIIQAAVQTDSQGDHDSACDMYIAGLQYLLPILTWGFGSPAFRKDQEAFRTKVEGYVRRAEALKKQCNVSNLNNKEEVAMLKAYDDAYEADALAESGFAEEALEKYSQALEVLVPMVKKFQGESKETMYKQVEEWIRKAEVLKVTVVAERIAINEKPTQKKDSTKKKKPRWVPLSGKVGKMRHSAPLHPLSPEETFLPTNTCRVQ